MSAANKEKEAKKNTKKEAKKNTKKETTVTRGSNKRTLWIALAVLALLAVLLWYLNRQGYLRRWFPPMTTSGRSSGRATRRPDYSPSAPPFPDGGF